MARYEHDGRTAQTKAAVKRLLDARRLQAQHRWRGAMYLGGYGVECKLKARLMEKYGLDTLEQLEEEMEHRYRRPINLFTHSIEALFGLTGARDRLLQGSNSAALRAFQRCNRWRPAWRYNPDDSTEDECSDSLEAVEEFGRYITNNV